ncbi:hypothetical protein AOXY_G31575 [Acipenser oxyrinchus oxyrinchus]|uniref:Myosin binding protein Ha n=1 Tax=Acipenser oxyrinchus oxyrinchus TaxID=40147 RepID=A0AAD8CKK1_ACIOX|nr:hypothetical protein AOXY_G31575 [Acipenser oxyrinchus oxyrinchus]
MPAKPAPIKKSPVKKAAPKKEEKPAAPAEPAPAPAPEPEPEPAPAPAPAEAAPAPAAEPAPAPAEEQKPAAEPAAPPPPPPEPEKPKEEPTSEPVNLTLEDVNDTTLTVTWRPPENIGASGLDGYTVEYCRDGTQDWVVANQELIISNRYAIKNLTTGDRLQVRVKAVNPGGPSAPATLEQPVVVREIVDRPKIRLPRSLRTVFVKKVGDTVNLVIPFQGKPKPQVSWTKDGQPLDLKAVGVRNSDRDTILFIRKSERKDSGRYEVTVKVDSLEDKATITIQIVDLPGPPSSIKLVDVWGFNTALEWTPPKDDGNAEITGYTVQKADKKTGEWFTVLEHYHRLNCTVSDLIMGNSYSFRVFTENRCGLSENAAVTKDLAYIQKTGIQYKPPEYKDRDYSEPPSFTQPLNDRAATMGYTTKLLCAVRGNPQPKILWMKNQMVIGEDPKFRQITSQGLPSSTANWTSKLSRSQQTSRCCPRTHSSELGLAGRKGSPSKQQAGVRRAAAAAGGGGGDAGGIAGLVTLRLVF